MTGMYILNSPNHPPVSVCGEPMGIFRVLICVEEE